MKRLMPITAGISIFTMIASAALCAETLLPGQIDFGKFSPPGAGGEFVEVNLSSSLISLGARCLEKEEPDVARLLNSVQEAGAKDSQGTRKQGLGTYRDGAKR